MRFVLSQNFESLLEKLAGSIQKLRPQGNLVRQWILVPNPSFKSWIALKLAKYSSQGGIAGCRVATIDEMLRQNSGKIPSLMELRCWIYQKLPQIPALEVSRFLSSSSQARIDLSYHLADLFFLYGQNEMPFSDFSEDWQAKMFQELFLTASFQSIKSCLEEEFPFFEEPIHCFGFDFLSPMYWKFLSRFSSCKVYLFSPSCHFWEDVCSDKEQRNLARALKAKGATWKQLDALQTYLQETPSLLANLGKIGRETLKILDSFFQESEEAYAPIEQQTVLHALQSEILFFEKRSFESMPPDGSMEVFKAGASSLKEVEHLSEKIISLVQTQNLKFSDILVLAPDIQSYVPCLQYVFSKKAIAYRISSVSLGIQSSFYQGIIRLMAISKGPWNQEKILALFETPAFSLKHNLTSKCSYFLEKIFQRDRNWKEGFWQELKRSSILLPGPSFEGISSTGLEELEKCFSLLQSLEEDLMGMQEASWPLATWAKKWGEIFEKYLRYDFENDLDVSMRNFLSEKISSISKIDASVQEDSYPFQMFEDYLISSPLGSIHGNHLHAVSCASLEAGSITTSKAIFLLGMNEESFPRRSVFTSLNLLRKTSKFTPEKSEEDRYLLLQVLLNAKDFLFFSYCHISPEDGKPIGPSLPLQEILRVLGPSCKELKAEALPSSLPDIHFKIGESGDVKKDLEKEVRLSDLVAFARHPWKYYLQKVRRIYLKDRGESSFAMQKGSLLRSSLEWPLEVSSLRHETLPGPFDEAFFIDLREKHRRREEKFSDWGKKRIRVAFLETAREGLSLSQELDGNLLRETVEVPPLEIALEGRIYRITGEVPFAMEDGALYSGDDKIGALLKSWPEVLASCIALKSNSVYCLKTGKVKTIEDPENALKGFLQYYESCRHLLSPLMPDWADALLRKTSSAFSWDFEYEDPFTQWMLFRLEKKDPAVLFEEWKWIKDCFTSLIALYPVRGRSYETV